MTALVAANGSLLKRSVPGRLRSTGASFAGTWTDRFPDGADEDATLASYESIYRSQSFVAAAVDKLTRQGSTLPLKVYKRGPDNERERLTDHPLERLLRQPLPRRGAVHFKQWALLPMLVHGNALIAKFRADPEGPPTNLLPIDWSKVEGFAQEGGPIELWATTQTGDQRVIAAEETLHFAWEAPNSEIGVSPLEKLGTTVRTENAAQRYQTASFRNGVRPSAAVTVPPDSNMRDPDVRKFYRSQLEALHKGVDQTGRVALLSPGADIKVLSFSAADAQLMQQRYVGWEEVQAVYDLAGPLVGDLRHGTYSNVEELNKQLYKSVLRPWLTLIEEVLQAQLIDPEPEWEGLFVEFDLAEALRGDPIEETTSLKMEVEAGLRTRNEARQVKNLPSDGDPNDPKNPANQLTVNANNQAPLADAGGDAPEETPEAPSLPAVVEEPEPEMSAPVEPAPSVNLIVNVPPGGEPATTENAVIEAAVAEALAVLGKIADKPPPEVTINQGDVNVAPPKVNVAAPARRKTKVVRDKGGKIVGTEEQED